MMKCKLRYSAIALMSAMILIAAYAVAYPQNRAGNHQNQTIAAPPPTGNTPGRIAKFTTTKTVGDSNIMEDSNGNIGIGTTLPTSRLTVDGVIEMLSGGIKFPNGTIQTTAGLATVSRDGSLKGDGTQTLPQRRVVEVKPEAERGFYLHPQSFGKGEERSVMWANKPEAEQKRQPR